jgi:hypothetical protein
MTDLEAEVTALRAQVASLTDQLLANGIRPKGWHHPDEPSDDEYDRLLAIVQERYPILVPKFDRSERAPSVEHQQKQFRQQFVAAFLWLQQARRSDNNKLSTSYAVSYWCDLAEQYARVSISPMAFCCAVVAIGDVSHAPFSNYPYDLAFGLSLGSRAERADVAAGWKRMLARQMVEPTPLLNPSGQTIVQPQELVLRGGGLPGRSFSA